MTFRTLDTAFSQVLVEFPLDPDYSWHHRVLLAEGIEAQWMCATLTGSVQIANFTSRALRSPRRDVRLPPSIGGDHSGFDPVTEGIELRRVRESKALAVLVGWAPATMVPATAGDSWKFSDPAFGAFGSIVSDALQADVACFVMRVQAALVLSEDTWTAAKCVVLAVESQWLNAKRNGPGRDPRIASYGIDSGGRRYLPLAQSENLCRDHTHADWPFRGLKASTEDTSCVLRAGCEFLQFDGYWRRRSDIAQRSVLAVTHRNRFLAEEQKAEAIISKGQRLRRNEQDSEAKRLGARNQGKNPKEEV
jgi:hypothetical protein